MTEFWLLYVGMERQRAQADRVPVTGEHIEWNGRQMTVSAVAWLPIESRRPAYQAHVSCVMSADQ